MRPVRADTTNMKQYQKILLDTLRKSNWDIAEIIDGSLWWELTHWRLLSNQKPTMLWISFISNNGEDFQTSVDVVKASTRRPMSRLSDEETVAELQMNSGLFDAKVSDFVHAINNFRNQI